MALPPSTPGHLRRRRQLAFSLAVGGPLLLLIWLFLGIEVIPDEHDTKYEFFTKQHPTFRLRYRNPVTCGVCDTRPFELLTADEKAAFSSFCRYRFGLDKPNECYAIFAEQQKSADRLLRGSDAPAGPGR